MSKMSKTEMKNRLNKVLMSKMNTVLAGLSIAQLDEVEKDFNSIMNYVAGKDFATMIESVSQEINAEWTASVADKTWKSFVNQIGKQISAEAQCLKIDKLMGV